jgi:hypothetical protein
MVRRFLILAVVSCFAATAVVAQEARPRRVQEQPAAAVRVPRAEPAASPLALKAIPFAPGETLSYDVEWNDSARAATVVLSVGERGKYFGQEGLALSADVETVGMVRFLAAVQIAYKSYSNPSTMLPFRAEDTQSINGKNRSRSIVFDRAKNVAVVGSQTTPIAADTGDPLSLFYRLRALPLKVGDTITLDGLNGDRRQQMRAAVEARESITTLRGRANAFRVAFMPIKNGQPDDSIQIRVWFTDDAARLPVLVTAQPEFGSIRMTLSSAKGTKS